MEQVNKKPITVLGLEIIAENIAIECILYQLIDNDVNTDYLESAIAITKSLENNINQVMASDISDLLKYRPNLVAYCHAIQSMCTHFLSAEDCIEDTLEAVIRITKKQRKDIENLIVTIAEL